MDQAEACTPTKGDSGTGMGILNFGIQVYSSELSRANNEKDKWTNPERKRVARHLGAPRPGGSSIGPEEKLFQLRFTG